eukprot:4148741-Prymnesium_polylepis.1
MGHRTVLRVGARGGRARASHQSPCVCGPRRLSGNSSSARPLWGGMARRSRTPSRRRSHRPACRGSRRRGCGPAGGGREDRTQGTRLDSTLLTARRQRTGTITGQDMSPHPHNPSRPLRSQHSMHTTKRPSHAPLRLDTHAGWSDTDVKNMRDAN